jgi:hypothetical protein
MLSAKNHNYMRYQLIMISMLFPLFMTGQDITPDNLWHDGSSVSWYNGSIGGLGVSCASYNGITYVFNFQDGGTGKQRPYVYTFRQNHSSANLSPYAMGPNKWNYLIFGYEDETYVYGDGIDLWRVCTFTFNGRLWYYQQIKNYNGTDKYSDCFAQMPLSAAEDAYTYCIESTTNPLLMRRRAFQMGDKLFFLSDNNNSSDPYYGYMVVEQFSWDSIAKRFSYDGYKEQTANIAGEISGNIIKRLDANGNEYALMCIAGDNYTLVYKMVPTAHTGYTTFSFESCTDINFTSGTEGAGVLIEGSIMGKKTSESAKTYPDRLTLFAIDYATSSDGNHHMQYIEYRDDNDYFRKVNQGKIVLPSSISPPGKLSKGMQMCGAFELVPTDWTESMDGIDGYRQYNWLIFPDGNKHFNFAGFQSDNWMLDPDTIVTSYALNDTSKWGAGIMGLWSMVGIVDGAPPVSMDWYVWDSTHYNNTSIASSLVFSTETTEKAEIANSAEDQWSVGESVDIEGDLEKLTGTISEEYLRSNLFKSSVSSGTTTSVTYDRSFKLRPETQDSGFYIYKAPKIKRYRYSAYPWWDTVTLSYPIPGSRQYMFRTEGYQIVTQARPLNMYPFYVDEPNGEQLLNWKPDARLDLNSAVDQNGVDPAINLSWVTHTGGISGTVSVSSASSYTYDTTSTYEVKGKTSEILRIPEVFRIQADQSGSWEGTYVSESTTTSELKQSIFASLEPLENAEDGIKLDLLTIDVFLLTPENCGDLWYLDSAGTSKPWYVGYLVNTALDKIGLLSPGEGDEIIPSEMICSWQAEYGRLDGYTLFISTKPNLRPENIIYRDSVGDRTYAVVPELSAEPGQTLYWTVRGYNSSHERIRSKWNSFIIKGEHNDQEVSDLKAVVFPNPGNGYDLRINIDNPGGGAVDIRLLDITGNLLAFRDSINPGTLTQGDISPGLRLSPGIYLLVIRSDHDQVVKKIIVN